MGVVVVGVVVGGLVRGCLVVRCMSAYPKGFRSVSLFSVKLYMI